jgi:hypothetical protein
VSLISRGLLSKYFNGVAVKRLSVVETTPNKSNQHEFNGSAVLRHFLGDDDIKGIPTTFIWLNDEQEGVTDPGFVTWYDARRAHPTRTEYRLYYPSNAVSALMKPGDTLFFARRPDGTAMVIITPEQSTIQNQLLWMFGIDQPQLEFQAKEIDKEDARLDFAVRYVLDELGIEAEEPEADRLDALIEKFGTNFPPTREFSLLARLSLNIDAREDPDGVLMAWLEREELLFRRLERRVVAGRLEKGFVGKEGADVDGFLSFSLSVQNRRKARAGQSLENHLEALFTALGVRFDRGAETENKNKPDFLFPGQAQYRDTSYPATKLTMLGAKSTCKDRWRQVLSEAQRIDDKHLLTLEPGISENQTDEMRTKRLQLVLPTSLHQTYKEQQRGWLMNVASFVTLVGERQS